MPKKQVARKAIAKSAPKALAQSLRMVKKVGGPRVKPTTPKNVI